MPLNAAAKVLPGLTASIEATTTRLAAALDRHEGLHILVLGTRDIGTAVARLDRNDVSHDEVNRLALESQSGTPPVRVGYVEIDTEPGGSPEGRIALAEELTMPAGERDHPNGAVGIIGVILCIPDNDLAS